MMLPSREAPIQISARPVPSEISALFCIFSGFSLRCSGFKSDHKLHVNCLNFRLEVSFFVQLSQFSSSCLNFRLDVSFFVQLEIQPSLKSSWKSSHGNEIHIQEFHPTAQITSSIFENLRIQFTCT
ncbi:hypothetical protein V9T40_013138 [Parthenolecanium corni]|uniref:Uncharacterized protein n=1 Tax=Parthenolecanium corni TaxID=536013 RepID=A0AAN9TKS3_9HEMI